ncbi:hypothetical protein PEB16_13500 [Staphylococcus aureus]
MIENETAYQMNELLFIHSLRLDKLIASLKSLIFRNKVQLLVFLS